MTHHDLAIIGATIVDGTGSARFAANVYVTGDAIAAVSPPGRVGSATEIVEAKGLILAPGFIDVHTHDDMALIHTPELRSKTSQGVTTVITGLCGYSAAPLPHGVDLPQEYDILIPEGGQTFPRWSISRCRGIGCTCAELVAAGRTFVVAYRQHDPPGPPCKPTGTGGDGPRV